MEELVEEGVTGLLVPPKDPEALARAIERLYHNESLRKSLAEAGYAQVVERFDLKTNIRELVQRFQQETQYETDTALVG